MRGSPTIEFTCTRCDIKESVEQYNEYLYRPNGWVWLTLNTLNDKIEIDICSTCEKDLAKFIYDYKKGN
jgi:hypothetical protein